MCQNVVKSCVEEKVKVGHLLKDLLFGFEKTKFTNTYATKKHFK